MFTKSVILTLFFTVASMAAYVDNIKKCDINDKMCSLSLFQGVYLEMLTNGIPEINLPPLEPFELKNETILFQDAVKIHFDKFIISGLKNCVYEKYDISIEKGIMSHYMSCNVLKLDSDISISGSNVLLQSLLGNTLNAHGSGTIDVENLHFHFNVPFKIEKNDVGAAHIALISDQKKFGHGVGKMKFALQKFTVDKQDISKLMTQILNENWQLVADNFGKEIVEKILDYYTLYVQKLFESFPVETFLLKTDTLLL